MEENNKGYTKEEIAEMESQTIDSYQRGDKPYRKKYFKFQNARLVHCETCGITYNLVDRLENGNKVYYCEKCYDINIKKCGICGSKKELSPHTTKDKTEVFFCQKCIDKAIEDAKKEG